MKAPFSLAVILLFAIPCFSQALPEAPKPKIDKKWLALSVAGHAAAAWDTEETIGHKPFLREYDPLARPIVNLPNPAYRTTTQALVLGVDFLSLKMKHSRHVWMKKTWWIPQVVLVGGNLQGAIYSHVHLQNRRFTPRPGNAPPPPTPPPTPS
jgi:hypothetical protein